jgi:hypothetical protein
MCRRKFFIGLLVLTSAFALEVIAESTSPFRGVQMIHKKVTEPRLIDMHIIIVDLAAPGIRFKVTGPSLLGESKLTTSRRALEMARDEDSNARLAVNAAFFSFSPKLGIYPPYCYIEGIAASEGRLYSVWEEVAVPFPALNISRDNKPSIIEREDVIPTNRYAGVIKDEGNRESWEIAGPMIGRFMADYPEFPENDISSHFYNAISGSHRLVINGTNTMNVTTYPTTGDPHPRTGIGFGNGKLVIVTVDGRNPKHSLGVTCPELADILIEHGATEAVNWDGGGSTTLAIADPTPRLLNVPVGTRSRPMTERPVGASLIIYADAHD